MYLCGVKRFRSLSKSLTYRIMAVVLVMMVIIAGVVYFTVRAYMLNEAQDRYLGLLLENHQEMRRKLSDVYVAVRNNIDDIENEFDQPEKLKLPSPGSFFFGQKTIPSGLSPTASLSQKFAITVATPMTNVQLIVMQMARLSQQPGAKNTQFVAPPHQ